MTMQAQAAYDPNACLAELGLMPEFPDALADTGEITPETQTGDDCGFTVEYQFSDGIWTHTRTVSREYAQQCVAFFAALDWWRKKTGTRSLDDTEMRQMWAQRPT